MEDKVGPEIPQLSPLSEVVFGQIDVGGKTVVVTAETVLKRVDYRVLQVLGEYTAFISDANMRKFVSGIPDLDPWKYRIPEADSVTERITSVTAALKREYRSDGRGALEIFLRNLAGSEKE